MHSYIYDEKKALKLKAERGVCFEDVIAAIENKSLLGVIPNKNQTTYPGQHILIVQIGEYVYQVPCKQDKNLLILKTVFPSRKFTKLFLLKKKP